MGRLPWSLSKAAEHVASVTTARRANVAAGAGLELTTPLADEPILEAGNVNGGEDEDDGHVDYIPRPRKRELSEKAQANMDYANSRNVGHKAKLFGVRRFSSFEDFKEALALHSVQNYVGYCTRHSIGRESHNKKLIKEHNEKQLPNAVQVGTPFGILPPTMSHAIIVCKCVHGYTQPGRGHGEREAADSRFTGCLAQIQAKAVYNFHEEAWFVETSNENRTHNHECNLDIYTCYLNSSNILDPDIHKMAADMLAVDGKARKVLDRINRNMPFSRRQLENFMSYRLGGTGALKGLKFLLRKFTLFGYQILLIEDQDGLTCGIALQTKMQQAIFETWGGNLILDWTHNTNNVGYYMGSFLVTTASGKGVSVYDFLCLTQTKDMMRAVFQHFVNTNPTALERVQSVVIDKDYREWDVLEDVFTSSIVVLCQFHVLKWFRFAVAQAKYSIPVALRDAVLRCWCTPLRRKILSTNNKYSAASSRPSLIEPFSAWNTTSNRLEAFWRQLKDLLGKKQRIDLCVEAIFIHATGVLERERDFLVVHTAALSFLNCSPFLEPLLRDISAFCANLVLIQWSKYASAPVGLYESRGADATAVSPGLLYVVRVTSLRQVEFTVDIQNWSCSCHFYRASWLPCRHLFYVADAVCSMAHYPAAGLTARWSLGRAIKLIGLLQHAIDELTSLRLDLLLPNATGGTEISSADIAAAGIDLPGFKLSAMPFLQPAQSKSVALMKVQRNEIRNHIVFNYFEKRQMVWAPFEAVSGYLTSQGTEKFQDDGRLAAEMDKREEDCASPNPVPGLPGVRSSERTAGTGDPASEQSTGGIDDGEEGTNSDDRGDHIHDEDVGVAAHDRDDESQKDRGLLQEGEDELQEDDGEPLYEDEEDDGTWQSSDATDDVLCEEDVPPAATSTSTAAATWRLQTGGAGSGVQVAGTEALDTILAEDDVPDQLADTDFGMAMGLPASQQYLQDAIVAGARSSSFDAFFLDIDTAISVSSVADMFGMGPSSSAIPVVQQQLAIPVVHQQLALSHRVEPMHNFTKMVIPSVLRTGHVRTSSQSSSVTAKLNLKYNASKCPTDVHAFLTMLLYCRLPRALLLSAQYPVLFDDHALLHREPAAYSEVVYVAARRLNFTVPATVLTKLKAVVLQHPLPRGVELIHGEAESERGKKELVVRFTKQIRGFTRREVQDLVEFADASKLLAQYHEDLAWLTTETYWSIPPDRMLAEAIPYLLPAALDRNPGDLQDPFHTTRMRTEVKGVLEQSSLRTTLSQRARTVMMGLVQEPLKKTQVHVGEVVGRVARTKWMNDSAVNFTLNILAAQYPDVVVIDSLNHGKSVIPDARLRSTRVVVFPLAYDKLHWCMICVMFNWTTESHVAFAYDPDQCGSWERKIQESWSEWCKGIFVDWNDRDERAAQNVVDTTEEADPPIRPHGSMRLDFVTSPRQTDRHSCGVHALLYADKCMRFEMPATPCPSLSVFQIYVLRLRILWLVMCKSSISNDVGRQTDAAAHADTFSEFYDDAQLQSARGRKGKSKKKKTAESDEEDSGNETPRKTTRKTTRKT